MATTKKAASTKKKTSQKSSAASRVSTTTVKTVSASTKKQSLGQRVESAVKSAAFWRVLAAEFIGTFLLASVIIAGQGQPIFVLFALVGIVLLIGGISGAHVNPAITIGAWATRRIDSIRAIGYILVQFLGAAVAYFALNAFLAGAGQPSAEESLYSAGAATLFAANDISGLEGKEMYILFAEIVGTMILGFAIAQATRTKDLVNAAFTAGTGILVALMVAVTAAGFVSASAIINPAVAVSLQAFDSNSWSYLIYILGPVIGGILGFVIRDLVHGKDK